MILYCTVCKEIIPQERVDRGADTCKSDCQTLRRKERRKRQHEISRQKLLKAPWFKRLVKDSAKELSTAKLATRTARVGL